MRGKALHDRVPDDDRERRKQLWFAPFLNYLNTDDALVLARRYKISIRLAGHVGGVLINFNSFLDAGYVYPSAAGLGRLVKNANGKAMSARQIRRVLAFMRECRAIRVVSDDGRRNKIFPLHLAAATPDMVSADPGHHVRRIL
jgi:hypothetical protein